MWYPRAGNDDMTEPTIDRRTFDDLKDTAGADFVSELVDTFRRGAADAR